MKQSNISLSRRAALGLVGFAMIAPILPACGGVAGPMMTVHKNPSCACCGAWAKHIEQAGFRVKIVDAGDLDAIKQRLGVPSDLASCHTAEVAGYVIEGHVPVAAVLRLLEQKPEAIGLAVPGMPAGSPGMETGTEEEYEVVLFSASGRRSFARFKGKQEI